MNKQFETLYHEVEATHWWFVSRRALVKSLVALTAPNRTSAILEIGCSGGPLLQQLRDDGYNDLTGIDLSSEAIALCRQRSLGNVRVMDAQQPDFPPASFEVITASDVLEHLADAPRAVAAWHRLLCPGGTLVVFVPAFQCLWSRHDEVNHHFHRYRAAELASLLRAAGFEIQRQGYWNFCLFLPVALLRLARRLVPDSSKKPPVGDLQPMPSQINSLLIWLLRLENRLVLAGLDFPWGISAMVLARKPSAA
jgi:2-polyprenyl-3-methyl-5-hydroxy-6-metoxy-1,4-benzoquinol methylase